MKKIKYILVAMTLICHAAMGQEISADKVPSYVTNAFMSKFPAVTVTKWEMENANEYEARFKINGEEQSASFDSKGKWLKTETEIETSALPASIQTAIRKDFAGYKITESNKVESADKGKCFEAEIKKDKEYLDVLYSADGKMLSKTTADEGGDEKDDD